MRIAQLASTFLPRTGGAEIMIHNLALSQQAAGDHVVVITWWGLARRSARGVPYLVRPLLPRSVDIAMQAYKAGVDAAWLVGWQVAAYQWRHQFDAWHIHMAYPAGVLAVRKLHKMGIPCVVTCHGSDVQTVPGVKYGARLNPLVDKLVRSTLQLCDRVVVISESMRQEVLGLGAAPERVRLIPNGIDTTRIQRHKAHPEAVRKKLGLRTDQHLILSVGRNHPVKGYQRIPEIIAHLSARRKDFLWLIVGAENDVVVRAVQAAGYGDHIRVLLPDAIATVSEEPALTLPRTGLIDIYKAADILVHPSLVEGMSLVMAEAMAAGLPIVSTTAPGCRDLVRNGETGLLADPSDAQGLAQHIDRLLSDAVLRRKMGGRAASQAKDFDWPVVTRQYHDLYMAVTARV